MDRASLLSTGKIKSFQYLFTIGWLLIFSGLLFIYSDSISGLLIMGGFNVWLIYKEIHKIWRLKSLSYNSESIFVKMDEYEEQIPFYDIVEIQLKDALGIHMIKLNSRYGNRKIYFKSSMWYPFNFKEVDEEIYKLNNLINKAKFEDKDFSHKLQSYIRSLD